MSPAEQAERDALAMALDTLIGLTAMHLEPVDLSPRPIPAHERVARIDPDWLELWRRNVA